MTYPLLNGIDHFHLYVKDKPRALQWYQSVMGFNVVNELNLWNDEHGPLTIEDQSKTIHLALFVRTNQEPCTSIAFKADAKQFLQWKEHLEHHKIKLRIADHQLSWSMYFRDIDDNMHEITSYQYAELGGKVTAQNHLST